LADKQSPLRKREMTIYEQRMINDALPGGLLSERWLADYRRTGRLGCGAFLIKALSVKEGIS
jgi:hypothetical protein